MKARNRDYYNLIFEIQKKIVRIIVKVRNRNYCNLIFRIKKCLVSEI
jgi:hypothetical protein